MQCDGNIPQLNLNVAVAARVNYWCWAVRCPAHTNRIRITTELLNMDESWLPALSCIPGGKPSRSGSRCPLSARPNSQLAVLLDVDCTSAFCGLLCAARSMICLSHLTPTLCVPRDIFFLSLCLSVCLSFLPSFFLTSPLPVSISLSSPLFLNPQQRGVQEG